MNSQAIEKRFDSLGGEVLIQAEGTDAAAAVEEGEQIVLDLHRRLTRFDESSELSMLNRDPRGSVPAGELMLRFAETVRSAGYTSGGLVDATLLDAVERAGYTESIDPDRAVASPPTDDVPARVVERVGDWSNVYVDRRNSTVIRPVGLRLDSGGIGKGLAADLVAERMGGLDVWAVECSGDLRFGGRAHLPRRIDVTSPFDRKLVIASLTASVGAVATSGTTRRSWRTGSGTAHHLIDPRTGEPAQTGIVQATAVAPTAAEAEVRAKSALLSGPDRAFDWLPDGGVVVYENGEIFIEGFEEANS